ncbi:hypothetical protein [Amycolatopsis sp. FDAARGOS 1241]|uniref:hypothetical protein n=1 Tax=Amycolatopsis sp. FDAARGOS 1241 TaxID=2778070 RepID=UPI0019513F03|nr:hypothetical protein [Amycolatopsis sp. FDAARGOS 1241]QRP45758.1 hypothetical protein I6J71_42850 [Amycolatopsis sp. FDAARGOS 1241]
MTPLLAQLRLWPANHTPGSPGSPAMTKILRPSFHDHNPASSGNCVFARRATQPRAAWISAEQAAVGIEGAVAKPLASQYPLRGGRAGWVKVRHFDDVDALLLGVTGSTTRPTALVLGQTDRRERVRAVGLSVPLSRTALGSLAGRLRPVEGGPQRVSGVLARPSRCRRLPHWPVEPGVVVEARADRAFELGRYRHRVSVVRAQPEQWFRSPKVDQ